MDPIDNKLHVSPFEMDPIKINSPQTVTLTIAQKNNDLISTSYKFTLTQTLSNQ